MRLLPETCALTVLDTCESDAARVKQELALLVSQVDLARFDAANDLALMIMAWCGKPNLDRHHFLIVLVDHNTQATHPGMLNAARVISEWENRDARKTVLLLQSTTDTDVKQRMIRMKSALMLSCSMKRTGIHFFTDDDIEVKHLGGVHVSGMEVGAKVIALLAEAEGHND